MEGPKAPKDPEKKLPGFYIVREKEIFGTEQPDKRGGHFLYENDGRLINSAQISGNITDVRILEALKTAEGFRSLVKSIGICIEAGDSCQELEFVFQMYGKKDIYGGGTLITGMIPADGVEHSISLSGISWSEDDKEPGQIQFYFAVPEQTAVVSVKLYVGEEWEIPDQGEEDAVDLSGKAAETMIAHSLLSLGNPYRLKRVIEKAKRGETVTLAYLGGSITQGAGAVPVHTECYARKSCEAFAEKFGTGDNVRYIKAGVGGTPSELGMIRFERDVLRNGEQPDLVVVEFAVNDEGDETKGICFESLVRKIIGLPWNPAVVLLFSVFANDWNLQTRLAPVGERYGLPMVSVLDAVSPQFSLKREEGRVISKNQYFYDMFHPTNLGHTIMAKCLGYLFDKVNEEGYGQEDTDGSLLEREPVYGKDFETVRLLDKKELCQKARISEGSFCGTDQKLQEVEIDMDIYGTPQFPYNWQYTGQAEETEAFTLKILCRALLLIFKDEGETDTGKADVFVDGHYKMTADPRINGWIHCNAVILFSETESREHIVEILPAPGEEKKKFTILGFGYVL